MKTAVIVLSFVLLLTLLYVTREHWHYISYLTALFETGNAKTSENWQPSSATDGACGQICSLEFDSKQDGRYYPLLRKTVDCSSIIRRMATLSTVSFDPPPRDPPYRTVDIFTQHGQCPVAYRRYVDSRPAAPFQTNYYNETTFSELMKKNRNGTVISTYGDPHYRLQATFRKYRHYINNAHVAVVGTKTPWAEAMLMNLGPRHVTTLEYHALIIKHSRLNVLTPHRFAVNFLYAMQSGRNVDLFDVVFSYSSLEHSGLGRYGDQLAPFGDAEAVAQIWCAVRPGGLFLLALPSFPTVDERRKKCQILWNAYRIYGYVRLQHVTANWEVLDEVAIGDKYKHIVFVLRKLV